MLASAVSVIFFTSRLAGRSRAHDNPTVAGISKESGLSTFRDPDGIWAQVRIEDVATPEAFARDPERVHDFYNTRRAGLASGRVTGSSPVPAESTMIRSPRPSLSISNLNTPSAVGERQILPRQTNSTLTKASPPKTFPFTIPYWPSGQPLDYHEPMAVRQDEK